MKEKEIIETRKDQQYQEAVIAKYDRGPLIRQYRKKATTIKAVSWGANGFSLLTAIYAVWYLANLYDGLRLWMVLLGGTILLCAVEFSKRQFAIWTAEGALNPEERGKMVFAPFLVLLVAASFFTSRYGGDQFVRNETTKPVVNHTALRDSLNEQIRVAYADIAVMKQQTWRGKITREAKRSIEKLTERVNLLTEQRTKLEARDLAATDEAVGEHKMRTANMGFIFGMIAGSMDFILILLLSWSERIEWDAYCLARADRKQAVKLANNKSATTPANQDRVVVRAFQPNQGGESRAPAQADAQARTPTRAHAPTQADERPPVHARTNAPTRAHTHTRTRAREEKKTKVGGGKLVCRTCGTEYKHKQGSGSSQKYCSAECRDNRPKK